MMSVDNIKNDNQVLAEEDFLEYALSHGFGDLHFKVDPQTGMKAMIAIHSTKLGLLWVVVDLLNILVLLLL